MDKDNFEWKKYLTACMESTDYCCIATVDEQGAWTNPVYFAWDDRFNLYFISQMSSRHMQNIEHDNRVAVAIYKTEQQGDVAGVQLEGSAKILQSDEDIKQAFNVYYARAGKGDDVQDYLDNPTWLFVQVAPNNIYYFDTKNFGEERQLVPSKLYN